MPRVLCASISLVFSWAKNIDMVISVSMRGKRKEECIYKNENGESVYTCSCGVDRISWRLKKKRIQPIRTFFALIQPILFLGIRSFFG